jgi:hypothetical protein
MIMKTKFCFLGLGIFITSLFVAQQSPSTSIRSERLQTFFERIKKIKHPLVHRDILQIKQIKFKKIMLFCIYQHDR